MGFEEEEWKLGLLMVYRDNLKGKDTHIWSSRVGITVGFIL